eukprot:TRINITY_DN1950_c0_g1_i2.p2 TRINITY_DN1950_c0_g1~~TRINITY_DN1950_c0_g1_i2.p2  ORF type:complete len:196 (+),score=66.46 TRINITY_DN1950_c0_g1_i2:169-756(+)
MVSDNIDYQDTLTIIIFSLLTTLFAEFVLWLMIYRKDEFKVLKKNIENQTNKLNKLKETHVSQTQAKAHEKKLSLSESQLKTLNQEMTSFRMKSTLLIGLFMIIVLSSFGTAFQGVVVAKLPFEPLGIFQSITHRGLLGEDSTDCSYIFIYIMFSFIVRGNIQKIFGFEPPRSHFNYFMNPYGQGRQTQQTTHIF